MNRLCCTFCGQRFESWGRDPICVDCAPIARAMFDRVVDLYPASELRAVRQVCGEWDARYALDLWHFTRARGYTVHTNQNRTRLPRGPRGPALPYPAGETSWFAAARALSGDHLVVLRHVEGGGYAVLSQSYTWPPDSGHYCGGAPFGQGTVATLWKPKYLTAAAA